MRLCVFVVIDNYEAKCTHVMATVFVFEMKNVFYQKKFVAFKKDILN